MRQPLPSSCRDSVTGNAYFHGCVDELTWILEDKSSWIAGLAMILAFIQVRMNIILITIIIIGQLCSQCVSSPKHKHKRKNIHTRIQSGCIRHTIAEHQSFIFNSCGSTASDFNNKMLSVSSVYSRMCVCVLQRFFKMHLHCRYESKEQRFNLTPMHCALCAYVSFSIILLLESAFRSASSWLALVASPMQIIVCARVPGWRKKHRSFEQFFHGFCVFFPHSKLLYAPGILLRRSSCGSHSTIYC